MKLAKIIFLSTLALILIISFLIPNNSYALSNPIVQSCSKGVTSPTTAALLSCHFTNPVTTGNMIIALTTCYGCSINANPINNDSLGFPYHAAQDSNCCDGTGAAQISTIFNANVTSTASDTVSAQIQDTVNRTTWLMSAYEVDGSQVNRDYSTWKTGAGFGGTATTVKVSPNITWSFTNSLIFEAAESDNGLQPTPTPSFISGATNAANQHAYSYNYSQSHSPDGFQMGTFGGATSMSESVIIIPFSPLVTATSTITGFLVPNFVNGVNSFSWLYFLIVVMVPMGEIIGVVTIDRNSVLDRHAIIFIFLGLLLLDSIFGVMLNVVTVAMPFIFGILFGIYLWRGRG